MNNNLVTEISFLDKNYNFVIQRYNNFRYKMCK
jgi:hypothetical protein